MNHKKTKCEIDKFWALKTEFLKMEIFVKDNVSAPLHFDDFNNNTHIFLTRSEKIKPFFSPHDALFGPLEFS